MLFAALCVQAGEIWVARMVPAVRGAPAGLLPRVWSPRPPAAAFSRRWRSPPSSPTATSGRATCPSCASASCTAPGTGCSPCWRSTPSRRPGCWRSPSGRASPHCRWRCWWWPRRCAPIPRSRHRCSARP
ncbi:hypothetical protein ACFQVA_07375 [Actinomadura keratinilytica]